MENIIKKNEKWEKVWESNYSLANVSIFGFHYFKSCQNLLGISFSKLVFIHKEGRVTLYRLKSENERFGNSLSYKMEQDESFAAGYCNKLKKLIIKMDDFFNASDDHLMSSVFFEDFLNNYEKITPLYIGVYWASGNINTESEQYKLLEETRKFIEPFYGKVEEFLDRYYRIFGEKFNLTIEQASSLYKSEIVSVIEDNIIPDKEKLDERFNLSALVFSDDDFEIFTGADAEQLEEELNKQSIDGTEKETNILKGMVVYKGNVKGVVKIINNPVKDGGFNDGDILVTFSTRPDFLPIIKQSAAIVTDQGGILSHAAIVSRELGKPCIIGTKIATKVLKDGDEVEVDADNGVVKIIKKAK